MASRRPASPLRRRLPRARLLVPALIAVGVIAGMLTVADHARDEADRARRAQVRMQDIRIATSRLDALTWRNLAVARHLREATVGDGVGLYRQMAADLRALRRLGVSERRIDALEVPLGQVYGAGMDALMVARADLDAGRVRARARFSPAIGRLNATIAAAAARQGAHARAAEDRSRRALAGSIGAGLLLLSLLGWRLHRTGRSSALAEQARAAEPRGEQRLRALVRHSSDVVAVVDATSRVRWIGESVRGMLGYEPGDVVGRPLATYVHPDEQHRAVRGLATIGAQPGGVGRLGLRVAAADGTYRQLEVIADNRLQDADVGGVLLSLRDVSERVALEEQLRHQAFHDSLTGLANRALFEDRLAQALVRGRRHGQRAAVVFVDLDDFKTVNDSLGHALGDELLRAVGERLLATLRAGDTAARLGGDEFAILLEDLDRDDEAWEIAGRLRTALEAPLTLGARRFTPSASIGVAHADPAATAADVLGNADVAMYAAKERGKGRVAAFEPAMRERVVDRMTLTADLETALERDELVVQYQPVVDLAAGAVAGVEALVRWEHPARGRLAPDRFIGLAESNGLIVPIGMWVLRTACRQVAAWERAGAPALDVSVNVSTRQLADPAFPAAVRAVLAETGLDPARLTLEITEHVLADDRAPMQRQLAALKDLGVCLAVDDFGTGYSALSYLQAFPIDVLKIDRSFVAGIDRDEDRARLVQGIVEMGHNLHLRVVAEGIEEPGEAAMLRDFRARYGQGYLFSRPVDADAIPALLPTLEGLPR